MFLPSNPTSRTPQGSHTISRRRQFHQRCPQVLRFDIAHEVSSPKRPTYPGSPDSPARALCIHPTDRPVSCFHSLLSRWHWARTGTKTSPRNVGRRGFRGRDPADGERSFVDLYGPGFGISLLLYSGSTYRPHDRRASTNTRRERGRQLMFSWASVSTRSMSFR